MNKTNTNFEKNYVRLNAHQRRAVDAIEGPVMVLAGPGTGKTQILTLRIANILLKTQANPENILALTFAENAAAEMKERLSALIGPDAFRVNINTFHGFCNELIQKHFEVFHHLASYMPISALEEVQLIQAIIENEQFTYLRPQGDPTYYFRPIRDAISALKKEGVSPTQFIEAVAEWKSDFEKRDDLINTKGKYKGKMKGAALDEKKQIEKNGEFGRVFTLYQAQMQERKLYDFNDMIMEVVSAFKRSDEFLSQVREMYQYILVDEHQDTNNAQNTIIEYICEIDDFPNLFVVGDEKQSIFRFQGASLENFLYFQKTFPRATLIQLQENYRSTQKILDTAHAVIQHNAMRMPGQSELTARAQHAEVELNCTQYSNPYQERNEIAQKIAALHSNGVAYEQIAIIVKKNADVLAFADTLEKHDIPVLVSTDESVFTDLSIEKIRSLLRAVYAPGDDELLTHVLLMDIFESDPLVVFQSIQRAQKAKMPLWEYLGDNEAVQKLITWKKQSENMALDEFFISLLNESTLLEYILKQPRSLAILEKLHVLYEDIKELQRKNHALSLKEYLDYLDLLEKHAIAPHIKIAKRTVGSVFVTTTHKAKGLEYEYVFIPKATDSYWGSARGQTALLRIPWKYLARTELTEEKEEAGEEERRLFYVALTRAKKQIFLSFSTQNEEGKDQIASRFLFEIPAELLQKDTHEELPSDTKMRIATHLTPIMRSTVSFDRSEMQEYISSLFIHNGVSISALNNYLTCPWRYLFRNLIRLPDVRGYYLLLGTAVHNSIKEYITQIKKHVAWGEEDLLHFFTDSITTYSASEKDLATLAEQGSLILSSYYTKRMKEWDEKRESELVVPNIRLDEDLFVNGKIDMIVPGKKNEVVVYDFKTGKAKSRNALLGGTQAANRDYYRQLVFYKLLLSLYKKGQYKMTEGVIEFVESGVEAEIKSESFEISDEDVKEVIQQLHEMRDSILNLSFWDKTCEDKECEYCKLRSHFYRPLNP